MNANSTRSVIVEVGGSQVVGHVGVHALDMFADLLGAHETLCEPVGWADSGTRHPFLRQTTRIPHQQPD